MQLQDELSEAVVEADKAVYWLVRLKIAQQREGWEQGPTTEEVMDRITCFLFNRDLDAGVKGHAATIKEFVADVDKNLGNGGWDSCTLVQ